MSFWKKLLGGASPSPIATNGIFWAKTGEIRVGEQDRSLVTILRFYDDKAVGFTTFADHVTAQDTVNKIRHFKRSKCNFFGDYRLAGNTVSFDTSNENDPLTRKMQGPQICAVSGTSNDSRKLLLKMSYPDCDPAYRSLWKDGEYLFEFHPLSFAADDP